MISKEQILGRATIAGGLALGVLAGNPSNVNGAGKDCSNTQADIVGVGYLNNPLVANRPLQPDLVDIIVRPTPDLGPVIVTWPDDVKNSNSPQHELRGFLTARGDYRDILFKFPAGTLSNTQDNNGNEALEVQYYFEKDKPELNTITGKTEQPRASVLIRCGYTAPATGGRRPPLSELEKLLSDPNYQFITEASVVNESMKNFTGQSLNLKPETVDQKEVRRAIQAFYDQEKKKAADAAAKQPETTIKTDPAAVTPVLPSLDSQPASVAQPVNPVNPDNPILPPVPESTDDKNKLILAGALAAGALLVLGILLGKRGLKWPWRKNANTKGEIEITPPPLIIKVNLDAKKPAPTIIDVKYPQPQVSIRRTPKK